MGRWYESPEILVAVCVGTFLAYIWIALPRRPKSGFRIREADRLGRRGPLQERPEIERFRTLSLPHEILGVSERASKREIQRAFRAAMKRFHPDRVGSAGHEIAQRLVAARDALLKRHV